MDKWNEFRTAYHVAKCGTVSGAADELGVHRATIIRHIDALEEELGSKVFFRNARGYSLTEVGEDLLRVAEATEDQFKQFIGRSHAQTRGVSGELVVSTIAVLCAPVSKALKHYTRQNPDSTVRCVLSAEIAKLEYGEAHVAIRAGQKPSDPDNVVIRMRPLETGLYAHESYVQANGRPAGIEEFENHAFIGSSHSASLAAPYAWLERRVPGLKYRFLSANFQSRFNALMAGIGLAFLPVEEARTRNGLVEVMPSNRAWRTKVWVVTHGATHRTPKVQSFLRSLREEGYLAKI
ncbi:MAG: LysR family transcriptional regulator [Pseudomonadota bacterium]